MGPELTLNLDSDPTPPKTFLQLKFNLNMVLINLAQRNFKYKPIMDGTYHPSCKKNSSAVNSCQSAVKLYLKKWLNLTLLSSDTLNIALFNILLIILMAPDKF